MNEINNVLKIFKDEINNSIVKEPPTKAEIVDKLCTYKVDNPGLDNTSEVDKISNYVLKSIKKYEDYFNERKKEINLKFTSANKGGYRVIKVHFKEDNIPGIFESICLYIPVIGSDLAKVIPHIYKHLLSNRISFLSKISFYNRSDNFIVYVYNKEDARSVINFCNNHFKDQLGVVNPFIAKIGSVGVSRELKRMSYNLEIASLLNSYIEDCILNIRKKAYDAIDFQNYVNEEYKSADNFISKSINYVTSASLYCILTKENILRFFQDDVSLNFDYDNYYRYEPVKISVDYEYLYSGKVINKDTDYMCFLKLQALNCLNKIHLEQTDESFRKNTKISEKFTFKLLQQLDSILNDKDNYNIKIDYKDNEIRELIPYLYAYAAYKYKFCNVEELKRLVDRIKKIIIFKRNSENDKIIYEQDGQKITSSIPLINTLNGSVAIDIIDYKKGMANIVIIKSGKRETYLNVYLKLKYDLIRNNVDYESRRYRHGLAETLLNDKRNKEALERRKKDFSSWFIKESEILKYLNMESEI